MERLIRNIFKLLLILFLKILHVSSQDYNLGMCADAECSVPVAVGITTINYTPPDRSRLGFFPNQEVIVYVRDYGVKKDLLGVELNGKKGYVPRSFVRETKSLAKATVPANLEFMNTRTRGFVYHETSHLHLSSNIPPGEAQNFIHTTVPNNFVPQQSMQSIQHSGVHLESSRHNDHSHFHASSDVYIAKSDDSRNYLSHGRSNSETPQFDSPSHSYFGSESTVASNLIPKAEIRSNSDNSIQSHHTTHSPESHWQNPSSQYHSHPNIAHGTFSESMRQNFDLQSNNLLNSQRLDPQSNVINHQTQAPHTTPQLMSQNQLFIQSQTQTNVPPVNSYDKGYDETMALLQNQGYNTAGEFTNQLSNQHYSDKQSTSFQNVHSENLVRNTDFHSEKPSLPPGHIQSQGSNGQNNLNDPSSAVKLSDIQHMVDSLFTEEISIKPSEPVATPEVSASKYNKRLAAKIDRIRKLAESFEEKPDHQSKGSSVNEDEEEDDEDYTDYESIYSSKSMETPSLDKSEVDLNLGMKSEQYSTLDHENFATKSGLSHNMESVQSESESGIQNSPTSSSPVVPTESTNEFLVNDPVSKSDVPENKVESDNRAFENSLGAAGENLSNTTESSTEVKDSNDDSLDSSTLEELDKEISLQDKENNSYTSTDFTSDDKDFIFDNPENIAGENAINESINVTESFGDSSKPESLLNVSDIKETENDLLNAYQTRHLKDVESEADGFSSTEETEQTGSSYEFDIYIAVENAFVSIRTFVDALLLWVPEPLYTMLMDLEKDGISPKVTVFTVISSIPSVILIVLLVFINRRSKENKLNARLTILERNFYNVTAEKIIVEEKLEKAEVEIQISRGVIEEEKILSFKLKTEVESLKQQLEYTTLELEKNVDEVDTLKGREHEYVELIHDHEREHLKLLEQKGEVETKVLEFEETFVVLRESLQEKEVEIQKLLAEKSEYRQANEIYEEKLNQLQKNCNQLLQEAEVWNLRVKELTEKLSQESLKNEESEKSLKEKDIEIESLSEAVKLFKTFEEIGESDDNCNTSEEKLKYLKNSTHNHMKLQKLEEENRLLAEKLSESNKRLLDIEVSIMDVKSENDKLKVNYNQALQDKAEALTKLEVLTNYFKDKEIQMQKQLGVQEAVRQRTEEDASSAERRIGLIEQENASYKYQVASIKQEIEETERNLKSQIALQEKKAHENWLAARTAERKLEDTKQEVMQLRQRLTLLEREQENWANSTRDEIIRPVPKRIGNINDDSINTQDLNNSLELRPNIFPPPPPMMLPPDRPLPPLPPLPPFLPPFEPPPPFRPQPWNMPPPDPLSNPDFRMTPSDYGRGRESTPPRGRNSAFVDGELGPRQSSPITDMKDSRNSTPPHLLPDFHDIPPHPSRPFYPPPPMGPRTRYPMPPRFPPTNYRRDYPGPRRIDNQEENSTYGSQNAPVPPDDWHNSNTRV